MTASKLSGREAWVVGWFGPKGFASVVYGILILQGGFGHLAHLVGLSVAASIVCLFVRRHICGTVVYIRSTSKTSALRRKVSRRSPSSSARWYWYLHATVAIDRAAISVAKLSRYAAAQATVLARRYRPACGRSGFHSAIRGSATHGPAFLASSLRDISCNGGRLSSAFRVLSAPHFAFSGTSAF